MVERPWRKLWCPAITIASLSGVLFLTVYSDGGIYPSKRTVSFILIALTSIFYQAFGKQFDAAIIRPASIRVPSFFLLGATCMQLVPLPPALLRVLSPARADLAERVTAVTGLRQWAPLTVNAPLSLLELTTALGCVLVFLLVLKLAEVFREQRWLVIAPLLVAGLGEATLGLAQASNPSGPATANGTFLNRNHFAGFLELLLPLAFISGLALLNDQRLNRFVRIGTATLLSGCGLVFLDAIFCTYSRLGLVVVLFVLLMLSGLTFRLYARVSFRKRGLLAIAFTSCALALTSLVPQRLLNRIEHASSLDRDSTDLRFGFWLDSVPLLADYPIAGCGLGGFESIYPHYQTIGNQYRVEYEHNDFLQALIELGIPAFLAGLLVLAVLMSRIYRSIWLCKDLQEALIAIGCFSSLSGMLLHSFGDFNLHIPANAITFAWILGFGLSIKVDDTRANTFLEHTAQ